MESTILNVAAESETAVSQPVSKVKQKARAVLQEMVANISPLFIRFQDHSVLKKQKKKTGLWLHFYFTLSFQADRVGAPQAVQWLLLEHPDPQRTAGDGEESCLRG